jgi:uncharacterized protein YqjF (DUF2071 family)
MLRTVVSRLAGASERLMAPLASLTDSMAQGEVMRELEHRPWPPPSSPWFMAQSWEDLLFAHWPLPPEELREVVPRELPIDTFDGSAFIGVTPFRVSALRLRGLPQLPRVSSFPETNVRTYVTVDGKPGIHFLSLDAASSLAVAAARRAYRLPYFRARMSVSKAGDWIEYASERISPDGPAARLRVRYRPAGETFRAKPGSVESFLAERYCLYTLDEARQVRRADIHHPPWPLQPAAAEIERNTMAAAYGLDLPSRDPLLHFARRQNVVIWSLSPAASSTDSATA